MTHVTCRLTEKNRDQLHTLGNRVLATFYSRLPLCYHQLHAGVAMRAACAAEVKVTRGRSDVDRRSRALVGASVKMTERVIN